MLSATFAFAVPVSAADTVIRATSTPTVADIKWYGGYVASATHSSKPLQVVASANSTYHYTDVLTIAEKGTTISFYDAKAHASSNAYVISSWVKINGSWVIDEKGVNISGCSSGNVAVNSTIQTVDSANGVTYSYTTYKDNETIRLTYCCTDNATDPEVTVVKKGAEPTANNICDLKFGTDGVISGIEWRSGYVGSASNVNGNVNRIRVDSSNYTYSELLLIPKKGTKISFTDPTSPFVADTAWAISSWVKNEDTGNYIIDVDAPNYSGTSDKIVSTDGNGKKYTYITYRDNELIRICYQSAASAGAVPSKPVTVYWSATNEAPTFTPAEAGSDIAVNWSDNTAMPGQNTGVLLSDGPVTRSGYVLSDVITVAKAGTKLSWSDSGSIADFSVSTVSSWKKDGDKWVFDPAGALFSGADGTGTIQEVTAGGKVNYTYVTSVDNENIRICVNLASQTEKPAIHAIETGKTGTWATVKARYYPESPAAPYGTFTGAAVIGAEKAEGITWKYGYIGAANHASQANNIVAGGYTYIYSDVITVPKAGTTVYFYDDLATDADGNLHASINAAIFSHWKKTASGTWVFDNTRVSINGSEAEQHFYGKFKQYSYTTTEDNETIRLCRLASVSTPDLPGGDYPVFFAPAVEMPAVTETCKLTSVTYTNGCGRSVTYKISLPTGYSEKFNGSCVFSFGADHAVADAVIAAGEKAVVVEFNGDVADAELLVEDIAAKYSVSPYFFYLVGNAQIKNECPDTFINYVADGGNDPAAAAKALLSKKSTHYNILEGLTMYAMGDSYFGGTSLGEPGTWVNLLGNKYRMHFVNYGIGGATVSDFVTNKNPMVVRYKTMEKGDADIILLEGGRNDRSVLVPMGTNDSRDSKTFLGALNIMIDDFLKTYPNAVIILVTPWYNTGKTAQGTTNVTYADAMKKLVEYRNDKRVYCIYAASVSETGVNMDDSAFRTKYCCSSTDVSHLNTAGMKKILPYMEKKIAEYYAAYMGVDPDAVLGDETSAAETSAESAPETTPEDTSAAPEDSSAVPEVTTAPAEETTAAGNSGCGSVISVLPAMIAVSVLGIGITVKKKKE